MITNAIPLSSERWYHLARDNIWSRVINVIYDLNPFEGQGIFFPIFSRKKLTKRKKRCLGCDKFGLEKSLNRRLVSKRNNQVVSFYCVGHKPLQHTYPFASVMVEDAG